jgi:threonine dehydrogenase-like Zn-dependent dehydrogenase
MALRAAAITAPGTVRVLEQTRPEAHGDLVVVKILIAPMCTEFKRRSSGSAQLSLGHEAAGIVVDAGEAARAKVGDRVVVMPHYGCGLCWLCTSGEHMYCPHQRDVLSETGQPFGTATYAEYILKPDWLVAHVPDDIELQHAALACCGLGPGFNALQRMGVNSLDTLLVSGCGPVGLGSIIQGIVRGARVLAVETHPYRSELARKVGAERVFNPLVEDVVNLVRVETQGKGVDAAIDTSGAPTAAGTLARSLRARGRLSFVSWGNDVQLPPVVPLGLDMYACWHWNHQTMAPLMWETVRRAANLLDVMITHRFPLDEVSAAMDIQDTGCCGKIYLLPHGAIKERNYGDTHSVPGW